MMSKRRDAPALYEVIRTRNERGPMPSKLNYAGQSAPPPQGSPQQRQAEALQQQSEQQPEPHQPQPQPQPQPAEVRPTPPPPPAAAPTAAARARSAGPPARNGGAGAVAPHPAGTRAATPAPGVPDAVRDPRNWPLVETRAPSFLSRMVSGFSKAATAPDPSDHTSVATDTYPGEDAGRRGQGGRNGHHTAPLALRSPSGGPAPADTVAAAGGGPGVPDRTGMELAAPPSSVLGLDRIMRIPVGYVFVAAGLTLVLILIAYSVGHSRGEDFATAGLGGALGGHGIEATAPGVESGTGLVAGPLAGATDTSRRSDQVGRGNTGGAGDVSSPNPPSNLTGGTAGSDRGTPQGGATGTRAAGAGAGSGTETAEATDRFRVDARQSGLNYINVERFAEDEALAVARFLGRRGIDVMVLPAPGSRTLFMVIVREGFQGWNSNQKGQETMRQIQRLGREWQTDFGGSKNFDSAYPEKFTG